MPASTSNGKSKKVVGTKKKASEKTRKNAGISSQPGRQRAKHAAAPKKTARSQAEEEEESSPDEQDTDSEESEGTGNSSSAASKSSDSEDEDEDELPLTIRLPAKRNNTKKSGFKAAKIPRTRSPPPIDEEEEEEEEEEEAQAPAPPIPKITYTFTLWSIEELSKSIRGRKSMARFAVLDSALPWEDVYGQLKAKICDALFRGQAEVEDDAFEILFSVARHVPQPLPLTSDDDYKHLQKNALKVRNDPAVKLIINQLKPAAAARDKENVPPAHAANEARTPRTNAKKAKSKAPRESDILPGNVAKNKNIEDLRARWSCNLSTCHSEFCYVPSDNGSHFPMGHGHFDKWAAAMLHDHHGEPSATIDHPPNISEFDTVSAHTIVSKSPILQSRVNSMRKEKNNQPVEPVQVHNHIYNQGAAAGPAVENPPSDRLIPPTHVAGPRLDMQKFAEFYQLPSPILQRFNENAITGTHAFDYLTSAQLERLGLKFGEIIDLREAVLLWAQEK